MKINDTDTVAREFEYKGHEGRVILRENWYYCGYVRTDLPPDADVHQFDVHGGVTYGPDYDGWIGFDCGHAGDRSLTEAGEELRGPLGTTFQFSEDWGNDWSPDDVVDELKKLIDQLENGEKNRQNSDE